MPDPQILSYVDSQWTLMLVLAFLLGLALGALITLVIVLREVRRTVGYAVNDVKDLVRTSLSSLMNEVINMRRPVGFSHETENPHRFRAGAVGFQMNKEDTR